VIGFGWANPFYHPDFSGPTGFLIILGGGCGKLDDEVNRIGIFVGIEKMCDKSVEGNKDFRNSHTAAPLCDLIGIDNRGRAHRRGSRVINFLS
jgi:hypothetical protein